MKKYAILGGIIAAGMLLSAVAEAGEYVLTLKDHTFSPQKLVIPAGQKVAITLKNMDATPAEFESTELNREKIVNGNSQITIYVGPLDPGTYNYFDEFHRDTTTGIIVAQPEKDKK